MWIYLGLENYIMQIKSKEHALEFLLSDLADIWTIVSFKTEIIARFHELNPIFDVPENVILGKVTDLYSKSGTQVSHQITRIDGNILLCSSAAVGSFSYKMELLLMPAVHQVLCQEFTAPILLLLKNMQEREERLVKIIEAKDVEIEEYRLEGVEIKRRGVVTAPFSYEAFQSSSSNLEPATSLHPAALLSESLQKMLGRLTDKSDTPLRKEDRTEAIKTEPAKPLKRPMQSVPESAGCHYTDKSEPAASVKRKLPSKNSLRL